MIELYLSQFITRLAIAEQEAAILRSKVKILEMLNLKEKNKINIEGLEKDITKIQSTKPKNDLDAQKLKTQLLAQQHTQSRQQLENMEADQRIKSAMELIENGEKSKKHYEKSLQDMIQAHGEKEWLIQDLLQLPELQTEQR